MSLETLVAEDPDCVSILQVTDTHIMAAPDATLLGVNTEHYLDEVLASAFADNARFDLMLLTGDLSQDATPASYERVLAKVEARKTPCVCLPGNHDDPALMQRIFSTPMVQYRRQISLGPWQIITLNSQIPGDAGGHLAHAELSALEKGLQDRQHLFSLVAVHHHCVPTQSSWMDSMIIDNRRAFLDILGRHPEVKGIVTGHIHQVLDTTVEGIRYLATPSTCFQFTPKSEAFSVDITAPGYRILRLYWDGRIESDVFRLTGKLNELERNTGGY